LPHEFFARDPASARRVPDTDHRPVGRQLLRVRRGRRLGHADRLRDREVGGAAALAAQSGAPVLIHSDDVFFAREGVKPAADKSFLSGRLMNRLPGGGFPALKDARSFNDGDVLDVAGGLRVLHTPGHSPGHVSLLHEPTRILITGDAIFNVLGIRISPPSLCSDFRLTQQSAHVLGEVDYDLAAFTHGPEIRDGARTRIRAYLSRKGL
jgi:glyoxylase-like metal-dependent hydrolase (beta-lactamase superfamily II)